MSVTTLPTATISYDDDWTEDFSYETPPSYTYKLHVDSERVLGYTDELEAYKQAVYKILNTERYEYLIYSWNYGIELKNLIGKHIAYVIPELERVITEAIMQDDRTVSVSDFEFDTSKLGVVTVTFKCTSIYGEIKQQLTMEI